MTDKAKDRKETPVFSGVVKYFPDALRAVAKCSLAGNEQHNPGKPLHWDRTKSGDHTDALMRHLMEAGTIDDDGIRHSTKVAWRALANLQTEIEKYEESKINEVKNEFIEIATVSYPCNDPECEQCTDETGSLPIPSQIGG